MLQLTDAVEEAISAGHWRKATELDIVRRARLEAFLDEQRAACGSLEHLRQSLDALQQRNNRMVGRLHHEYRRLTREFGELETGKRAVRAYLDSEGA